MSKSLRRAVQFFKRKLGLVHKTAIMPVGLQDEALKMLRRYHYDGTLPYGPGRFGQVVSIRKPETYGRGDPQ